MCNVWQTALLYVADLLLEVAPAVLQLVPVDEEHSTGAICADRPLFVPRTAGRPRVLKGSIFF